jgi:hypothetical protein
MENGMSIYCAVVAILSLLTIVNIITPTVSLNNSIILAVAIMVIILMVGYAINNMTHHMSGVQHGYRWIIVLAMIAFNGYLINVNQVIQSQTDPGQIQISRNWITGIMLANALLMVMGTKDVVIHRVTDTTLKSSRK